MIVLDVETTGTDYNKHSIVSMGAVDFDNPKNQFYEECQIWEGAEITDYARDVNGFTKEQVTDPHKQTLEETVIKYLKWSKNIKDKTIAGENPRFDRDFLQSSLERYGIEHKIHYRTEDLHSLSYAHHIKRGIDVPLTEDGISALSLNETLKYVGLPEEPDPHNALTGAKMEAEAFSRFFRGKFLFEEFEEYEVPDYLK